MTRALGVRVGYTAREECPHGYVGLQAPQESHLHPPPGVAVVAVSCGMAAIQAAHLKQIHLHLGLSEAEMWATRPSNQSRTSDSCCERHTYLQPSASSAAGVAGHFFSAERASSFSRARKSQHTFFFYPPVFWYVRLGHEPRHSKMCLHSFPRPTRPCREYKDACLLQAFVSWCMPAPFCLRMTLATPC